MWKERAVSGWGWDKKKNELFLASLKDQQNPEVGEEGAVDLETSWLKFQSQFMPNISDFLHLENDTNNVLSSYHKSEMERLI